MKSSHLIRGVNFFPYYPGLKEKARQLRKNMTPAERKLWFDFLKLRPEKWYRQRPIDFFIVDFMCAKAKVIIEIDGSYHLHPKQQEEDAHRQANLEAYHIEVIRFSNKRVLADFTEVCREIEALIELKLAVE